MAKYALLIGITQFGSGYSPLPGAAADTRSMERVLTDKNIGDFDEVETLLDSEPQRMRETIERFFLRATREDLLLFFFSGHGIKDDSNNLHLATTLTRKSDSGQLVKATAIPSDFIKDAMVSSRCRRQIIILDCCFSGAFAEGLRARDAGDVDIKRALGGEGRAVLTSSTSTQSSFEMEGREREGSFYTRFLVEGLESREIDTTEDGLISVSALHDYAKKKIQQTIPSMKPEIFAAKEGYSIVIAKSHHVQMTDMYRKELIHQLSQGSISPVGRAILDQIKQNLRLDSAITAKMEGEITDYYQRLHRYEILLRNELSRNRVLGERTRDELEKFAKQSELKNEDVAALNTRLSETSNNSQYDEYRETFRFQIPILFHVNGSGPGGKMIIGVVIMILLLVLCFIIPREMRKEKVAQSNTNLIKLGTAMQMYTSDYDETFPPMSDPKKVKSVLQIYLKIDKSDGGNTDSVFVNPSSLEFYTPNPSLSEKDMSYISSPTTTDIYSDLKADVDGYRGVLYADWHVRRVH